MPRSEVEMVVAAVASSQYICVMCYCVITAFAYTSAGPLSPK